MRLDGGCGRGMVYMCVDGLTRALCPALAGKGMMMGGGGGGGGAVVAGPSGLRARGRLRIRIPGPQPQARGAATVTTASTAGTDRRPHEAAHIPLPVPIPIGMSVSYAEGVQKSSTAPKPRRPPIQNRQYPTVFNAAVRIVNDNKSHSDVPGAPPGLPYVDIYALLIEACALFPGCLMQNLAWTLFNEMKERGMRPTSAIYHHLLRLLSTSPDYLKRNQVLAEMKQRWFQVSEEGWEWVVRGLLRDYQFERALEIVEQRVAEGAGIGRETWEEVVIALAKVGEVEANWAEEQRDATLWTWRYILTLNLFPPTTVPFEEHHFAALIEMYLVINDIPKVLSVLQLMRRASTPPSRSTVKAIVEGMGRWGDKELDAAVECVGREVKDKGRVVDVAMVDALIGAYAGRGKLREAWRVYKLCWQWDVSPGLGMFNFLLGGCAMPSPKEENAAADATPVPLMDSGSRQGNIDGAAGKEGKEGEAKLSQRRSQESLKKEFAMYLVHEMTALGIHPDVETYEHLIYTCLNHAARHVPAFNDPPTPLPPQTIGATRPTLSRSRNKPIWKPQPIPPPTALCDPESESLNNAFEYLEEMVHFAKFRPRQWVLRRLLEVCLGRDDERVGWVLGEMENTWGYWGRKGREWRRRGKWWWGFGGGLKWGDGAWRRGEGMGVGGGSG
ncbi:hypothetical protein BDZ91DRAFT_778470 [Kalaharituber pfeilii]|nr:hypothetical protein BDZ91DRAFT_778470 [Kalaharituber pfeilii]